MIGDNYRFLLVMALPLVLLGSASYGANSYEKAIENGRNSIPCVKEMQTFFPTTSHNITYYTGEKGSPIWRSKVGIFGRYVLIVELGITFDAT